MVVVITIAVAPLVMAQECQPSTSVPELAWALSPVGTIYADADCWQPGCLDFPVLAIWVYEESNGIEGLQRSDMNVDDTCGGVIASDDLVS